MAQLSERGVHATAVTSSLGSIIHAAGSRKALSSMGRRFAYALVPQLIRTHYFSDPAPATTINTTSWMNGIRGIAAVIVFNEHFVYFYTRTILYGVGTHPGDVYIHQLPVFELFNDGVNAVVCFFAVSGYVCSYNALKAATMRDPQAFFKSLPASVFRRWFRLYLPVMCSTFSIAMLAYFGFFEPTRFLFDPKDSKTYFPGPATEVQPPRYDTLSRQLLYWWAQIKHIINFWVEYPSDPQIDVHLWTIVYEFRSSMHLFVAIMAFALCKPWIRILGFCGLLCFHTLQLGHAEMFQFFGGAILAQLDVLRSIDNQRVDTRFQSKSAWYRKFYARMRPFLFALALYFMSFPMRGGRTPAPLYKYTANPLIPKAYGPGQSPKFIKALGVLLLMHLLTTVPVEERNNSRWHRMLTSPLATYLGKVMFASFLVHGMVLHVFGLAIPHAVWYYIGGNDTNLKFMIGLTIGWIVSLMATYAVADVWTREVEGRCTRLTKWLESVFFEHDGPSKPS